MTMFSSFKIYFFSGCGASADPWIKTQLLRPINKGPITGPNTRVQIISRNMKTLPKHQASNLNYDLSRIVGSNQMTIHTTCELNESGFNPLFYISSTDTNFRYHFHFHSKLHLEYFIDFEYLSDNLVLRPVSPYHKHSQAQWDISLQSHSLFLVP